MPHPIGGVAEKLVAEKALNAVDAVLAALTGSGTGGAGGAAAVGVVARHPAPDDLLAFQGFMMERGWVTGCR